MKVERAAVIGAGAMGSGIAQVLSQAGIEVVLKDVADEFVERGLANIKRMYDSRVRKEVLQQKEADALFGKVSGTTSYDELGPVDIVIEAALERIDVKLEIFKTLDSICPTRTILASNTSALSISELAAATKREEKVLGMHFFNPAQTMKLVEVIPGVRTSKETVDLAMMLCKERLNKIPVKVSECPGFLVNRVLFPYMNEALYALQEGAATVEQIDEQVVQFGLPMGPFTLFDMTGIDICSHVVHFLHEEYGPRFQPSPLLARMVEAGAIGQKSGAGFYVHEGTPQKGQPRKVNPELEKLLSEANQQSGQLPRSSRDFDAYRVVLPMFNEALYAIQENVVKPEDVDVGMKFGCGLKRGLLTIAEEKGMTWCVEELERYHQELGERFRPSWLVRKLARAGIKDFSQLQAQPATC